MTTWKYFQIVMICAAGRVTPRFILHVSSKPEFNRLLSVVPQRRYVPSRLENVENVEEYRPGGFHSISIGDVLAKGRYKFLHKLGFKGSSTVWFACDQCPQQPPALPAILGPLMALRVLSAELSSEPKKSEIAELALPILLAAFLRVSDTPVCHHVQVVEDHFMEEGPNGIHLCLVYPFAGLSVRSMSDSRGRVPGSRRLLADLAKKVAKQTATAVDLFHSAGLVHGGLSYSGVRVVHPPYVWQIHSLFGTDLTTSNILFIISEQLHELDDSTIHWTLGNKPVTNEVRTCNGTLAETHGAPRELVEPVDMARLSTSLLLQKNVVVIDLGQSFATGHFPKDYESATTIHYVSPEARFESIISPASDTWGLACAIFEIRVGSPLFEPFLGNSQDILKQTVHTLGKLLEPWWNTFENRELWFEENGETKPKKVQEREGVLLTSSASSI